MRRLLIENGYDIIPRVVEEDEIRQLLSSITVDETRAGDRLLHKNDEIRRFVTTGTLGSFAAKVLGEQAKVVRVLYFDKTPAANWKVPYHQDLTIMVNEKADVGGYRGWSTKSGIMHVQPPASVLENMLAFRLHLDDCGKDNGPVRVLPGTHNHGRIPLDQVDQLVEQVREVATTCRRGDVLLMRPLLLHASSPATSASHRRVLHVEYSAVDLAPPLAWFLGWRVKTP